MTIAMTQCMNLYRWRRRRNAFANTTAIVATAIGLSFLAFILAVLIYKGLDYLSPMVFEQNTPPPGDNGGLLNAIVGSFMMTGLGVLAGAPLGILAGTYMAEYGKNSPVTATVRFVNEILLSAPSIIVGLFIYEILVFPMGHFSGLAGAAALAVMVVPVVVHTTETMLGLVPNSLREAATALGMTRAVVIRQVAYRAAKAGIVTGVLLAVARVSGETAPLLFTALNNQFYSTDLDGPMASLPVVIFQFAISPYSDWQGLAWTGALLITFAVLILSILARMLSAAIGVK